MREAPRPPEGGEGEKRGGKERGKKRGEKERGKKRGEKERRKREEKKRGEKREGVSCDTPSFLIRLTWRMVVFTPPNLADGCFCSA